MTWARLIIAFAAGVSVDRWFYERRYDDQTIGISIALWLIIAAALVVARWQKDRRS